MDSSLTETIINQAIGAVIGTIVSFAISWYFYVKSDGPTRILRTMIEQLALASLQERLGGDYVAQTVANSDQPRDKDVPHITTFWLPAKRSNAEAPANVLFRVVDTGLNFHGQIEASETSANLPLTTRKRAYGFYSAELPANSLNNSKSKLLFKLTDMKGKTHSQSVRIGH